MTRLVQRYMHHHHGRIAANPDMTLPSAAPDTAIYQTILTNRDRAGVVSKLDHTTAQNRVCPNDKVIIVALDVDLKPVGPLYRRVDINLIVQTAVDNIWAAHDRIRGPNGAPAPCGNAATCTFNLTLSTRVLI